MDTNRCFPVAERLPFPTEEDIGTCDTVKSIRIPRTHIPARGLINRSRHGIVAIALQFNNADDATAAIAMLEGWRVGSDRAPHILIWAGNYSALTNVSKLLRNFGADMREEQFSCHIPT